LQTGLALRPPFAILDGALQFSVAALNMPRSRVRKKKPVVVSSSKGTPGGGKRASTKLPMSKHRKWSLVVKSVAALAFTALGAIASFYQLAGGPPWPTTPEIDPGPPDNSQAFDVPFMISNRSAVFDDFVTAIYCVMADVELENGGKLRDVPIQASGQTIILHSSTRPFTCWFPVSPKNVKSATMWISISYKFRFLREWTPDAVAEPFTWDTRANPPRWLKNPINR
jgi:hypothetical protein